MPQKSAPSSLLLQGERGSSRSSFELSSSGGVWLVRKGEKMKESEGKRKEARTAKRFPPNYLMRKKSHLLVSDKGLLYPTHNTNYQKLQIQTLLQGESRKKTKKRTKSEEVKRVAGTVKET